MQCRCQLWLLERVLRSTSAFLATAAKYQPDTAEALGLWKDGKQYSQGPASAPSGDCARLCAKCVVLSELQALVARLVAVGR